MKEWPPQIWASIVALAGVVAGWLGRKSNNRADAAAVLTDGALKIVQELQEELSTLRIRMAALERKQVKEQDWCDQRINQLVRFLHENGIEVPPSTRPDFG